jgi:hypothetical protein
LLYRALLVLLRVMPGASEQTRRVKALNANWNAGSDGDDGRFEVMIVTDDDQQHTIAPSPVSMMALTALTQADTVLLWDPADRTLIAANIVGSWLEVAPGSGEVRRRSST